MLDSDNFDFLTTRLHLVDVSDDQRLNMELWQVLGAFETHVYGVVLQYDRIKSALSARLEPTEHNKNHNAGLDTYYYILTWDKLKKIFERFITVLNRAGLHNPKFSPAFWSEFRVLRKKLKQLFSEFHSSARNEYEHPSLAPYTTGNVIAWGHLMINGAGDVKAHVAGNVFVAVKVEHCNTLKDLRTELIDLFLKHFSEKTSTKELLRLRDDVEQNVDSIVAEFAMLREKGDTAAFNELLHRLMMTQIFLSREGVPLTERARTRLYSAAFGSDTETTEE